MLGPSGSYAPSATASFAPSYAPSSSFAPSATLPPSPLASPSPSAFATPSAGASGGGGANSAAGLLGLTPAAFSFIIIALLAAAIFILALGCTVLVLWRKVNLLETKAKAPPRGEGAQVPLLYQGNLPSAPPRHGQ